MPAVVPGIARRGWHMAAGDPLAGRRGEARRALESGRSRRLCAPGEPPARKGVGAVTSRGVRPPLERGHCAACGVEGGAAWSAVSAQGVPACRCGGTQHSAPHPTQHTSATHCLFRIAPPTRPVRRVCAARHSAARRSAGGRHTHAVRWPCADLLAGACTSSRPASRARDRGSPRQTPDAGTAEQAVGSHAGAVAAAAAPDTAAGRAPRQHPGECWGCAAPPPPLGTSPPPWPVLRPRDGSLRWCAPVWDNQAHGRQSAA